MVIFYHAGIDFPGANARLGVSAFFVMSGFLITWLLLNEYDRTSSISLKHFYSRRILRIFPAYYVFIAASIVADLTLGDERIKPMILPSLSYYTNYFNAIYGQGSSSVSHMWSLAIEEQFYLIWPLLLYILISKGGRRLALKGIAFGIASQTISGKLI